MEKIKTYTIEVGIERPWVNIDDTFEIELQLYQCEIDAIIKGGKEQLWVDNDLEPWEYIDRYAKDAYQRAVKLAEAYTVPKWGEKMLVDKGAYYNFFLPDSIADAIYESEEFYQMQEAVDNIEDISTNRFHEDSEILQKEESLGRWSNRLVGNKNWDNQIFYGIWTHPMGKIKSEYIISTLIPINHSKVEISYEPKFEINSIEVGIRIHPANKMLQECVELSVVSLGYKILREYAYLPTSYVVYVEGNYNTSDVSLFMGIIDKLVKLS